MSPGWGRYRVPSPTPVSLARRRQVLEDQKDVGGLEGRAQSVGVVLIGEAFPIRSVELEPVRGLEYGNSWKLFRSEEHTSELQSRGQLVCRLLHEKKTSVPETPPT